MKILYKGQERENAVLCWHCLRVKPWDEETCEVYNNHFICSECYEHFYGNCNRCGRLHKYTNLDENIICKKCQPLEYEFE